MRNEYTPRVNGVTVFLGDASFSLVGIYESVCITSSSLDNAQVLSDKLL